MHGEEGETKLEVVVFFVVAHEEITLDNNVPQFLDEMSKSHISPLSVQKKIEINDFTIPNRIPKVHLLC